jgi:hypothetical protein
MGSQVEIKKIHVAIISRLTAAKRDLECLQDVCPHPAPEVEYKASTGNYDPSADRYWKELLCQDCGKSWITEE